MVTLYNVWSDLIITSRNGPHYVICVRLYVVNTVINVFQTEIVYLNWMLSVDCKVFDPYLTKIWNIYHANFRSLRVLTKPVIVCGTSTVAVLIMSCRLYNYFFDDSEKEMLKIFHNLSLLCHALCNITKHAVTCRFIVTINNANQQRIARKMADYFVLRGHAHCSV
jgi:hypothetical protein